jgi:hypothetical protein
VSNITYSAFIRSGILNRAAAGATGCGHIVDQQKVVTLLDCPQHKPRWIGDPAGVRA